MKKMEQKKITALGDSLTRGVVLNESNRYSVLNGSFIDIIREKLGFEIANYGKFGCTIDFGDNIISRYSENIADSEYTLLEYGGNDCDFDWRKIADTPQKNHMPKTPLEYFKKQFIALIERVKQLGSKAVITSLPPILSDSYFSFFSRLMSEEQINNVVTWLGGDIGIISRWHESYNRALFMVANQTKTPIIDITTPFDTYRGNIHALYCTDGIHPNEAGHKLIAETIINNYL